MEQKESAAEMLSLMLRPAFAVRDGEIIFANDDAWKYDLAPGMRIEPFLRTGMVEYAGMPGGCLYLTLSLPGGDYSAAVTRMDDFDVFTLDRATDLAELQALALAAQELRTPLSRVMTVADQLFPVVEESGGGAAQDQIASINRGLFQLLRILGNMSDAYRYCQKPEPQMALTDIGALADEIFGKTAELLSHADIALHFTNLRKPVVCLADEEILERGIHNILSNAVKFSQPGGVIEAKLAQRSNMLYLTVQSSGSSAPTDLPGNLHTRYMREPGVEDGRYGIGLGMVLIRSAAAAHGGTVLIDQPYGQGMRITMTLAIRQDPGATVRSNILHVDYAGERDHSLIELSDVLPAQDFRSGKIN